MFCKCVSNWIFVRLGRRMICNMVCEVIYILLNSSLGPVSRKPRKLFGPEKPFVKLRPAYSAKLVFSYVVKGMKIKITAKFRASRRLTFEDTKRIMSPEMRPKSFGTFEKQAPKLTKHTTVKWSISQKMKKKKKENENRSKRTGVIKVPLPSIEHPADWSLLDVTFIIIS